MNDQGNAFPEAGGIVYGKLYKLTPEGTISFELSCTARATTMKEALKQYIEGIEYAKSIGLVAEGGNMFSGKKESLPQQASKPSTFEQENIPPEEPSLAQEGDEFDLKVVGLEIGSRKDGKINLEFFAPDRQFPDLYKASTVEDAVTLLSALGNVKAEHLKPGKFYEIDATIRYKLGKLNSKGKPYKDIVSIRNDK